MRWLFVVWLMGCRYHEPLIGGDDAGPVIPDVAPDASCRSTCQDATMLLDCATGQPKTCPLGCHADVDGDRCAEPVPSNGAGTSDLQGVTGDLIITHDAVLETATGGIVETGSGNVIRTAGVGVSPEGLAFTLLGADRGVIGARRMVVANGATLAVAGPRVAIILTAGDITIEGIVDASGGRVSCTAGTLLQCPGAGGGRGGDSTQDGSGCSPGKKGNSGGGDKTGGGGGGYGTPAGGNGGMGGDGNAGGAGGSGNCSVQKLDPIAAGSGGGGGGGGGAGGGGGGAIQLTALGNLVVRTPMGGSRAGIKANGAGGQHGGSSSGGGGGGSSGGILLEGQSVTIQDATLAANAGSGGAGDGGNDGNPGRFDDQRAAGGTGGLAGGFGAARTGTPTAGTGGGNGTGGGGGGIGRIFVNAGANYYQVTGTSVVSPVEYSGVPASM
jgi:hypothetical protein